jgi:phosphoglycolate phosphatase
LIGRGGRSLLQRGLAAAGAENPAACADALFDRFIDHYRAHIADQSRPFPGAIGALKILKAANAKLVVCTNKRTDLSRSLLAELDMAGLFDAVVGADAVSAIKPDAAHLMRPWPQWAEIWRAPSWSATRPPTPVPRGPPGRL